MARPMPRSPTICWKAVGERSRDPYAHGGHVSTIVTLAVPAAPVTLATLPHIGLSFGLGTVPICGAFSAATIWLSVFVLPQDPRLTLNQVPSPENVVPLDDPDVSADAATDNFCRDVDAEGATALAVCAVV